MILKSFYEKIIAAVTFCFSFFLFLKMGIHYTNELVREAAQVSLTPSPNPPSGPTGYSPGGTSTSNEESLSDSEKLVKENGELEEIDTNCRCNDICPVCDGCLMINVPRGCEACSCCNISFSYLKCISNIRVIRKVDTILTTLWSSVNSLFLILVSDISNLVESIALINDYIKVELTYAEGTLSSWSGDLKFECGNQEITYITNESVGNQYTANLTNEAYLKIYGMNSLTGEGRLLYQSYDKIRGNYIPVEIIEREGIPEVGENVYKTYRHYNLLN